MKLNLFIILLIPVCFLNASAQTGKGSFMIGGSINLQHTRIDYPSTNSIILRQATPSTTFSLNPTVGYFFIPNLMTGVQISDSHTWASDHDSKSNSYGGGPLLRYYFPFGKFAVFPEAAMMFSKTHSEAYYTIPDPGGSTLKLEQNLNTSVYRAGAGIAWFVSPNVGIEGIIAYRNTASKDKEAGTTKQSQLYLNIGIQFYLAKKN